MSFLQKSETIKDLRSKFNEVFDDLFENSFFSHKSEGFLKPKINLSEDEKAYFLEAELAGVKKEDINVSYANGVLTLKASKKKTSEEKEKNFHRMESYYGTFNRSLELPNIKEDAIEAEFEDGILKVRLEKERPSQPSSPRKITIK
jgi:HSP20 family protein